MSEPVLYEWPNGMKSIAGGTRGEIKLSRPWQQEIVVNPETCPFCTGKGHVLEELEGGEWLLLQNRFTPYPFHRMVIPRECWPASELRTLGGITGLTAALQHIQKAICASTLRKIFVAVHIGALAGQHVCHLHYHIVQYALSDLSVSLVSGKMREIFMKKKRMVLFEDDNLFAGIGGLWAGQCFILPMQQGQIASVLNLARTIDSIVSLCNKRFKSAEGLSPDFSLAFQFLDGEFQYGIYTPALNHFGGAEQMALYESGCPVALPWPHELTAEYLKS